MPIHVLTTTLQKLKDAKACVERYSHLRDALGKSFKLDTSLPLTRILETNGHNDVLWALDNAVDGGDKICRLWAADCAEHVLPAFLKEQPNDTRPADAIKAVRQFARGEITAAARAAAGAAAWDAAMGVAWDVAWAAAGDAAGDAAWAAARAVARAAAAARAAARAASGAASGAAALAAAWDAAMGAAWAAEEKWQTDRLIAYLNDVVSFSE